MFKKLKEVAEGRTDLLTIRCVRAWLERRPSPILIAEIDDDMEVLTASRERREHYPTSVNWLKKQLAEWRQSNTQKVMIASTEHPLEVVTGDTGLILKVEGKRYLWSVYRDIPPKGWLMPGGCPRSISEILNPRALAVRECSEEILISDTAGRVYNFFPSDQELTENIEAWQEERSLQATEIISLPAKELQPPKGGDAQKLVIRYQGEEKVTSNVDLRVDADISSLALTLYWEVVLPIKFDELRLFDGEKLRGKTLLNRPVRLVSQVGGKQKVAARFSRGDNIDLAGWITPETAERAVIP